MDLYFKYFGQLMIFIIIVVLFYLKSLDGANRGDDDGFFEYKAFPGPAEDDSPDYIDAKRLRKSVQSEKYTRKKAIMNNTAIFLPRIGKDFPGFNFPEMQKRAQTTLISYLRAIDQEDPSLLTNAGEELKTSLKLYLNMLRDQGVHENFDDIKIHSMEIARYFKDPGRCIITLQSALECRHNKIKDGEVTDGSEDIFYQTKFELEMVYIQDREKVQDDGEKAMGFNCPNCGAPVKSLRNKVCEYCGAAIMEYNIKVWTITSIKEI